MRTLILISAACFRMAPVYGEITFPSHSGGNVPPDSPAGLNLFPGESSSAPFAAPDPRVQAFCRNPYSICSRHRGQAGGGFYRQTARSYARYGNGTPTMNEVVSFLYNEVKQAMYYALATEPGLSAQEREIGIQTIRRVRMNVSSDPMACGPGGNRKNAMAQQDRGQVLICLGMVKDAIRRAQQTGRSFKNFLFHPAAHELGHFLDLNPMSPVRRASGMLAQCIESNLESRRGRGYRGYGGDIRSSERLADAWSNNAFYQWLSMSAHAVQYQVGAGDFLTSIEDSFSTLCNIPGQMGNASHPPVHERADATRYSPLGVLLGCEVQTDNKPYCTVQGEIRRGNI